MIDWLKTGLLYAAGTVIMIYSYAIIWNELKAAVKFIWELFPP